MQLYVWKVAVCCRHPLHLAFSIFLSSLPLMIPEAWEEGGCDTDVQLRAHRSAVLCSPYVDELWDLVAIAINCTKKLL